MSTPTSASCSPLVRTSLRRARFWPDGGGLLGNGFGDISFEFIEPQLWIAVDYPGEVGFTLLLDGELVFETATTFDAPWT